jgi:hypothetical protein
MDSRTHEIAPLLDPNETGRILDLTVGSLANWRHKGIGPKFIRVGGRIKYRREDLASWIEQRCVEPAAA